MNAVAIISIFGEWLTICTDKCEDMKEGQETTPTMPRMCGKEQWMVRKGGKSGEAGGRRECAVIKSRKIDSHGSNAG